MLRHLYMKKINDIFLTIADKVSYIMGTPINIIFWLLTVGLWFYFAPIIAKSSFLPNWFISNEFNFPLNTVTTLLELFIGFLVGASANRSERLNKEMIAKQNQMLEQIVSLQNQLLKEEITIEEDIKIQSTESNNITINNAELQ